MSPKRDSLVGARVAHAGGDRPAESLVLGLPFKAFLLDEKYRSTFDLLAQGCKDAKEMIESGVESAIDQEYLIAVVFACVRNSPAFASYNKTAAPLHALKRDAFPHKIEKNDANAASAPVYLPVGFEALGLPEEYRAAFNLVARGQKNIAQALQNEDLSDSRARERLDTVLCTYFRNFAEAASVLEVYEFSPATQTSKAFFLIIQGFKMREIAHNLPLKNGSGNMSYMTIRTLLKEIHRMTGMHTIPEITASVRMKLLELSTGRKHAPSEIIDTLLVTRPALRSFGQCPESAAQTRVILEGIVGGLAVKDIVQLPGAPQSSAARSKIRRLHEEFGVSNQAGLVARIFDIYQGFCNRRAPQTTISLDHARTPG